MFFWIIKKKLICQRVSGSSRSMNVALAPFARNFPHSASIFRLSCGAYGDNSLKKKEKRMTLH
jgi:hypothetical protein